MKTQNRTKRATAIARGRTNRKSKQADTKVAAPSSVAPVATPPVAVPDNKKQARQGQQWRAETFCLVGITCEELEDLWGYDTSKLTKEDWEAFCHRVADCLDGDVNSGIEYRAEQFDIARLPDESQEG
jgi:hypothetical protein